VVDKEYRPGLHGLATNVFVASSVLTSIVLRYSLTCTNGRERDLTDDRHNARCGESFEHRTELENVLTRASGAWR
jgi:hypothetical protein